MAEIESIYLDDPPDELQQGDICLAPIVRLESDPHPNRSHWKMLDEYEAEIHGADSEHLAMSAHIGYNPVMVISHDCQMDKEMNIWYRKLRKDDPTLPLDTAIKIVETDPQLDRFVTVVPIIPLSAIRTDAVQIKQGQGMGYFYVPPLETMEIARDSAADLSYPSTIDRNLILDRSASLTDKARGELRLALARLYAFRTPEVGFEVEAAIGQRISGLRRDPASPLEIIIELGNGDEMRLVLQPQVPKVGRPSVRAPKK